MLYLEHVAELAAKWPSSAGLIVCSYGNLDSHQEFLADAVSLARCS